MKPVIIGGGLAGLTVALSLAPIPAILLSPTKLGTECSTAWAQGGIAAAVGDDDNAELHSADTLAAGAGLCDAETVKLVTNDGARIIEALLAHGTPFDKDTNGKLRMGLEAAHSRRRIVHAADQTGAAIIHALIKKARMTPSIEIIEDAVATKLLTQDGAIAGVAIERNSATTILPTRQVVLATGGVGALWQETSNPLGSWGRGLALATKAGAILGDLEFMQFHPTGIDIGRDPMPLASEALRGEGCTLIDDKGERFIDELQPRDIVARAIYAKRAAGSKVFLDARTPLGQSFAKRFPTIYDICLSAGIDPAITPIPVAPLAHYHMGGVVTDANGRTNVEGLWACGEVACTGLHGANRLASNSLLEAASFGRRVAEDITGTMSVHAASPSRLLAECESLPASKGEIKTAQLVRSIMSQHVGVVRDAAGLTLAVEKLTPLAEYSDMALIGKMIAQSALQREESRGAHMRTDFPAADPKWLRHQQMTLADVKIHATRNPQRKTSGA